MTAYYNEIDPYAAQWLRNLIAAGHIATGYVDERSIEDVRPFELAGFTQCHFFAGIGIWSLALRNAGWSDSRPVWTGSCPCQPFSAAGKGKQFADERHLWPALFHLASVCRPPEIIGEQVASSDGLAWLDLVQADMENAGYAFGALDLSAAGFADPEITGRMGGAHIRQRLYWGARRMADAERSRLEGLAGHVDDRHKSRRKRSQSRGSAAETGAACALAYYSRKRTRRNAGTGVSAQSEPSMREHADSFEPCRAVGGLADAESHRHERRGEFNEPSGRPCATHGGAAGGVDWIPCRDGKWRPVESGTFPLANEDPQRLGRLRAYGNAIDAATAKAFISAWMDCAP